MLKVEYITTGYGKKQVLTDVSFEVDQGEVVLLSGGNGSGKSTVLKTIYGLLKPWKNNPIGKVFFEGEDITALPVSEMIAKGIVYMPQKKNVFEDFTVEENLSVSAGIYPKKKSKERIDKVYEILPILKNMKSRRPFYMSGGEKQLLAFGNALIHSPKLMLLDEPFAGVDAVNSEVLARSIENLKKDNITCLIVEHKENTLKSMINKEIKLELGEIKK